VVTRPFPQIGLDHTRRDRERRVLSAIAGSEADLHIGRVDDERATVDIGAFRNAADDGCSGAWIDHRHEVACQVVHNTVV
jgi:hypothetical protein